MKNVPWFPSKQGCFVEALFFNNNNKDRKSRRPSTPTFLFPHFHSILLHCKKSSDERWEEEGAFKFKLQTPRERGDVKSWRYEQLQSPLPYPHFTPTSSFEGDCSILSRLRHTRHCFWECATCYISPLKMTHSVHSSVDSLNKIAWDQALRCKKCSKPIKPITAEARMCLAKEICANIS